MPVNQITANNPNLEPVPSGEWVPFETEGGWFRTKEFPGTRIAGTAEVDAATTVARGAFVFMRAKVKDRAIVSDLSKIFPDAVVSGCSNVSQRAIVGNGCMVMDNARLSGQSEMRDRAIASHSARMIGRSLIKGSHLVGTATYIAFDGFPLALSGPDTLNYRAQDEPISAICRFFGTIHDRMVPAFEAAVAALKAQQDVGGMWGVWGE